MKKVFLLIFALVTTGSAMSQAAREITGSVVDEYGNSVKYATIGIPGKRTGTLTDANGAFTLEAEPGDTLLVSHVSYDERKFIAKELPTEKAQIVMCAKELKEAVVYSGKRKNSKLAGRGMRVPGGTTMWTTDNIGCEIGSIIETERIFEVDVITFKVRHNSIDGAKLSINIYRADKEEGEFTNMLCKPIYTEIPASNEKQEINIKVNDVVIEPGKWFVALKLVDYKRDETKEGEKPEQIFFPLYLKSSYLRKGIMDTLEECPVNMGLTIKGVEYK